MGGRGTRLSSLRKGPAPTERYVPQGLPELMASVWTHRQPAKEEVVFRNKMVTVEM